MKNLKCPTCPEMMIKYTDRGAGFYCVECDENEDYVPDTYGN